MQRRKDESQASSSLQAIKQYKKYVEEREGSPFHHKACVLLSKWDYCRPFEVGIVINENIARVILCGDNEFCREYKSEYTNQEHIFQYIPLGTLLIKDAEDNWGNKTEIDISYHKL